ncbi:unnamed protein product [Closterium sp. Naga37s-1]|nr:unnamed protein product [Closterium sp. Naga37s-1]
MLHLPYNSSSDEYLFIVADDIEQEDDDRDVSIGNAGAGRGATMVTNGPPVRAKLGMSLDLQQAVHATLAALQASGLPTAPFAPNNGTRSGTCTGSGSGSNDTEDATHASELKRAMAAIMEPSKLSSRCVAVFQKCITEGDGTGDKGLNMWPDHKLVVQWSAATGAVWENQKERPLYCLNHSTERSTTWSAVAARMPGGITRDGLPFSVDEFEIFIAAAYWRLLSRKVLRIYPYTLAFALYGVSAL